MAYPVQTSKIKTEIIDNPPGELKPRDVDQGHHGSIFECADCKRTFYQRIHFLQHREVHKRNARVLLTNNNVLNCESRVKQLNSNGDVKVREEVQPCTQPKKNSLLEVLVKEEIEIEIKNEFEGDEYTLQPFTEKRENIEPNSCVKENGGKPNGEIKYEENIGFKCNICDKTYSKSYKLQMHTKIHTREKLFKCVTCGLRFSYKSYLKHHKIVHTNLRPHQCTICNKTFRQKGQLNQHLRCHTEEIGISLKKKSNVRPVNNRDNEEATFQCEVCHKKFVRQSTLFAHHYVVHSKGNSEEKHHDCSLCHKKFRFNYQLIQHKMTHTGEKPFKCSACHKSFRLKHTLNIHKKIHTLIHSTKDSNTFNSKDIGATHESITEQNLDQDVEYKNKWEVTENNEKENTNLQRTIKDKNVQVTCNICHKTYSNKYKLKTHQITHTGERPFKCYQCDTTFKLKDSLRKHQIVHQDADTVIRPFKCEICNRTYKRKGALTQHMLFHTGEKPFECKICLSRFRTKLILARHSYMQHPEDNLFEYKNIFHCDVCQKKFVYKSGLVNHKKKHTDVTPFNCDICQKGFWKKPQLVKHLEGHSSKEEVFVVPCREIIYIKEELTGSNFQYFEEY